MINYMEESDKQFAFFAEQMEIGNEQLTTQAFYIEVLEKKIGDYETKMARSFSQMECDALAVQRALEDKIWDLKRALEEMENRHLDEMRQMTSAKTSDAKTSDAKTSATGCFSGINMRWCR